MRITKQGIEFTVPVSEQEWDKFTTRFTVSMIILIVILLVVTIIIYSQVNYNYCIKYEGLYTATLQQCLGY